MKAGFQGAPDTSWLPRDVEKALDARMHDTTFVEFDFLHHLLWRRRLADMGCAVETLAVVRNQETFADIAALDVPVMLHAKARAERHHGHRGSGALLWAWWRRACLVPAIDVCYLRLPNPIGLALSRLDHRLPHYVRPLPDPWEEPWTPTPQEIDRVVAIERWAAGAPDPADSAGPPGSDRTFARLKEALVLPSRSLGMPGASLSPLASSSLPSRSLGMPGGLAPRTPRSREAGG